MITLSSDELSQACVQARVWLTHEFNLAHARVRAWDINPTKGTDMPRYFTCPVGGLLIGDVWMQSGDEVVITELPEVFDDDGTERVRIHGRIVKGWGKSNKIRRWVFMPTQTLEVRR